MASGTVPVDGKLAASPCQANMGQTGTCTSIYDRIVAKASCQIANQSGIPSGKRCCVPGCKSDSRYQKIDRPVWFHCIPTDKAIRRQWIVKIMRDEGTNFKITSCTMVCSLHFKPSDYRISLVRRTLIKGTVPSVFNWTKAPTPRKGRAARGASGNVEIQATHADMREQAPSGFELRIPTTLLEVCSRVSEDQTGNLQTLHATTSRGEDVAITVKSEDRAWIDLFFQGTTGSIIDVLNDRWRCSIESILPELPRPHLSGAVVAQVRSADKDRLGLSSPSTEAATECVTDVDEIPTATDQSKNQTQSENGGPRRISRRLRDRQQRSSTHRRGSEIVPETVLRNVCFKTEDSFDGDQVVGDSESVELDYAGSEDADTHTKINERKPNGDKKCGKKYEMVLEITDTNVQLSLMTQGLNVPVKIEAGVAENLVCSSTEDSVIDDSCQPSGVAFETSADVQNMSDVPLARDGDVENTSDSSPPDDEDDLLKVAFPIFSSRNSKEKTKSRTANAERQKQRRIVDTNVASAGVGSADIENTSDVSPAEDEDGQLEFPGPSEQDQEKTTAARGHRHKRRRLTDTNVQSYSCPECEHQFVVATSLMKHLKAAHVHLPNYDAIVNAAEDLRSRQLKRASAVAVSCPVCMRSMRGTRIFSHLRKWHADDDAFDTIMQHAKTSFYTERERVYKLNDWGGEKVACPHCGLNRVRRRLSHHIKFQCKENAERRKFLRCRNCGYGTHCPDRLAEHSKLHQEGSNFVCHNCGKSYISRSGLTIHLRNKHQEANVKPIVNYTCPVCAISYIQESRLKKHMAIHAEERRYLCDVCGKAFKDSSTMCMHVRTQHLRQYRYFCQACGHGVEKRSYLERHRCGASASNGALAIVLGQQVEQCEVGFEVGVLEQQGTVELCDEGGEIATGCAVKVEALMIDDTHV